ncbi:hypothetical protein Golomagni_07553 [Golovinomyces magnicellulatus]|nr:hypothetical protein Golomagni_07553 [Golovinomyces magnicellulatus]
MGKRKSSSKPMGPKKKDPLPTTFTCLFCNHEKSVNVKLDRKAGVGQLDCRICGQKFQCAVNCKALLGFISLAVANAYKVFRPFGSCRCLWRVGGCSRFVQHYYYPLQTHAISIKAVAKEDNTEATYAGTGRLSTTNEANDRYEGDGVVSDGVDD